MRQPVRVVLADDHDAFVEGLGVVLSAEGDLEIVALAGDGASALQAVLTHRPDVLVVDTRMPGPGVTELVRLVGQAEPSTRVLLLAEDARLEPSSRPDPGGPAGMTRAVSARELAAAIRAVAAGLPVVPPDPPAAPAAEPRSPGPGSPGPGSPRPGSPRPGSPGPGSPGPGSPGPGPPGPGPPGHASPRPGAIGAPEREGSRQRGGALGAVHSPGRPALDDGSGRPALDHDTGRPALDDHAELLLRSLSERERQILGLVARGYSNRRIAEVCFLSLNTVRTHVQNVLVKLGAHSKLEAAALAVRQGLVRIEDHPA
jgi:DNA-binding NarL/FixJ family response regulator